MSQTSWKIEDGVLWRWDPELKGETVLGGWRRVGLLEDLAAKEALDLPACTVEQALGCAAMVLVEAEVPLRALFSDLDVAVFEEGAVIRGIQGRTPPTRRALALALRALSERLLEVS